MTEPREPRTAGYPYGEFDAMKWAEEFDRIFPDQRPDTDTMLGWFANAIMTGYDKARNEAAQPTDAERADVAATYEAGNAEGRLHGYTDEFGDEHPLDGVEEFNRLERTRAENPLPTPSASADAAWRSFVREMLPYDHDPETLRQHRHRIEAAIRADTPPRSGFPTTVIGDDILDGPNMTAPPLDATRLATAYDNIARDPRTAKGWTMETWAAITAEYARLGADTEARAPEVIVRDILAIPKFGHHIKGNPDEGEWHCTCGEESEWESAEEHIGLAVFRGAFPFVRAAIRGTAGAGLDALWSEPHYLGFPVSSKTGTYDHDTVMVKRDWYDRLARLAAQPASEEKP